MLQAFLDYLELGHPGNIANKVDQGQAVHNRAILGGDEVRAPPLNGRQHRQTTTTGADGIREHTDITGAVADEGVIPRRQMGNHNLTRLPGWQHLALGVHDLDDNILRSDVHAALGAGMGDKSGVTAPIAIGHGAAKH